MASGAGRRYLVVSETKNNKLTLADTNLKLVGSQPVWNIKGQIGKDVCILDLVGIDKLGIENSCSINLTPGLTWNADEADTAVHVQRRYTVKGEEMVQVPAGTFRAIRIAAVKLRSEVTNPLSSPMELGNTQRIETTYWYAPNAKGMIKVEREIFDVASRKLLVHSLEELEHFKSR